MTGPSLRAERGPPAARRGEESVQLHPPAQSSRTGPRGRSGAALPSSTAMSGQSLTDRITAAQHSVTGSAVSKTVCKATTHEVMGPKKKHLDCEYTRGDGARALPALRAGLRGRLLSLRPRGDVERRSSVRFGIGRCGWGVGVGGSGDVATESLGEAARRACARQERPPRGFLLYA